MKDSFLEVVANLSAEYADLRFEENRKTRIAYEGKQRTEVATSLTSGGHVRVYAQGGLSTASFSDPSRAKTMAQSTRASATLVGGARDKRLRVAPAPVITDDFPITPTRDPRTVSLQEKIDLATHYNEQILRNPHVITTQTVYDEFASRRVFVNSDGSAIEYDVLNVGLYGLIVTKKGSVVQQVRFAFGGNTDFSPLLGREADLQNKIDIACALLDAEPAKAGVFPVVLDPSEAGVFIHEAFGHLSEADGLQNNPSFRAKLQLGQPLGRPILNVSDDATLPNLPGSFRIDDEGVPGMRTRLITEGVLSGRLHSRETAAEFNEPLSGNMRAVDVQFSPIVRMSNILIESGDTPFDEMIASVDHGYYLVGAKGGQTSGDQFTFGAQWGYRIVDGKLGPMVRDINMSGELFSTLESITMIGDDLRFGERGGCGKGGGGGGMQLNRMSGKGSPHIKIEGVTIGGI